jgi:hypothetical protein
MNQKPDFKNYSLLLAKITEANTKKYKAQVESANARLELAKLKEEMLKAGALDQLGVDFFVNDIDCW